MTPQDSFLYAAPLKPGRKESLRLLLSSMNLGPGVVNRSNPVVPFAQFGQLHFARVLLVTEPTKADRRVFGLPVDGLPEYLAFMGEIDGTETSFRDDLLRQASPGLHRLFSHCEGFEEHTNLEAFLKRSRIKAAATYVNWVGRTATQVREESILRFRLEEFLSEHDEELKPLKAGAVRARLQAFVAKQQEAGLLTLTPEAPTPLVWRLRRLLHLFAVPLLLLLLSPLLLLYLPVYLWQLRRWERTDPEVNPPLDPAFVASLMEIEDHDMTNQFSVFGSLKPGLARRCSMRFFLLLTDYTARHLYTRGGLARVSTIHFARWIPFDGGRRMLFSSLYDGSRESYNDDFINKVGFGLNITFNAGIGYPRTRWLLFDGCRDEQTFKRILRRHQLPTDVWYNAHPGLTAANKHRNALIRTGLQSGSVTEKQARDWLALF